MQNQDIGSFLGKMDLNTKRIDNSTSHIGNRDVFMIFGSAKILAEPLKIKNFQLTPYGRLDLAHINLKAANKNKFNIWLGVTVSLAIFFVFLQALEYYEAYEHYGLTLNSGIYGSTFFMLTGFHGFHVMMGGLMLSVMLIRSVFYNHFKPDPHEHFGFEAASWYWHFVDVVWVMLFMFVYIL